MLEIDKKKYPKSYKAFNWKNLFDKNNNEIKNKWILINKKGNRFVLNNKCPFHLHNQYMLGCIKTNLTYDFIYAFEDSVINIYSYMNTTLNFKDDHELEKDIENWIDKNVIFILKKEWAGNTRIDLEKQMIKELNFKEV